MDTFTMKAINAVLTIACGVIVFSSSASAIEEVIVTGYPQPTTTYDVPGFSSSGSGAYSSSFGFVGGYKDAAIAAAKQQCVNQFSEAQKQKCDKEKEAIHEKLIQNCNALGTGGTAGMAVGGAAVVAGGVVAFAGGPIGWAVALSAGGAVVGGGGTVVQQEGNYGCRDDANATYQYNTQACINYANKLKTDFCSKIN